MSYLVVLTFLLAPAYIIRFTVGGLPVNALLVWIAVVGLLFAMWLWWGRDWAGFFQSVWNLPRPIIIFGSLFFLAGTLSLFVNGFTQDKFGQFIVLFLQPISIFFIARYITQKYPQTRQHTLFAFYCFVAVCGFLALLQYFWLIALPPAWWGNSLEPKRAIAMFVHPNAFALFVTPLLAFLIPDLFHRLKNLKDKTTAPAVIAWLIGSLSLVLSLSRGGWFGLFAAVVVYAILNFKKRYLPYAAIIVVLAGLVVYSNSTLRYRLLLPFYGEKSAVARLSLWQTGTKMIKDSPILGQGLLGFNENWYKFNTDPNLDHYNSPHNIVLNFWVDTGLLGAVSMIGLIVYLAYRALRSRTVYGYGVLLFLVAMVIHGLIDTPYLKNDLALQFWLVAALLL